MDEAAKLHQRMLAMNEALLLGSMRQHELAQAAEELNERLHAEIAEHKRTEEALRGSEARYRMLFESIDEGFCVIEKVESEPGQPLDFRYIEVNPAFTAQSGMHDVIGKTIRQAFPGETENWFETYDAVLRTGKAIRFERGLVSQGRVLDLYAVRVEDGTNRRVAVIFSDITERKRTELATASLAAIVNSSDDAIISKDLHGVIRSWNKGAERIFGYTAQEAIGQSITLLIPRDRLREETEILERLKRGDSVEHFDTVRIRKDGSPLEISLTISPIKNVQGRVVGASKIARDITERKRAEDTLQASETRFRNVTENIPQLAWFADGKGNLEWYNRGWLEYTGTTLEENLGMGWKAVHHPDYVDAVAEKFIRHLREGLDWEDTFPLRGHDGTYRWFLSRMNVIRDESGNVVRFFGTNTDVTEQRAMQAELKNSIAVAEKANLAKSEFLSRMSHELRTPLTAILGFAQLMEAGTQQPTPLQKRSIGRILEGGWYLLELINEVLDLAQIESGKVSLALESVSVADLMCECQDMFELQMQQRGINVTFVPSARPYFVLADRIRLKQVLFNLLSNAIKYNRVDGGVSVESIQTNSGRLRIGIGDTGNGLSPDQLSQLFQPFNRLGQEFSSMQGTGIGLVVCKRLIESMGGAIGVESTIGKGSVFWIELDLAAQAEPAAVLVNPCALAPQTVHDPS